MALIGTLSEHCGDRTGRDGKGQVEAVARSAGLGDSRSKSKSL